MRDIVTKNTGDSLTADEFNDIPSELENIIRDTGITLSSADLFQLSKAVAVYASGGTFYVDSGAANAVVLTPVGSKKAPPAYFNGMRVDFKVGNTNTGTTTINVAGLGVKAITNTSGGGELPANQDTALRYNLGTDEFEIIPRGGGAGATGGGSDKVFFEGDINVTTDYTITSGKNAMSAGPVTIDDGVTVTVPVGSTWTVV